jgi:hypothetical protein
MLTLDALFLSPPPPFPPTPPHPRSLTPSHLPLIPFPFPLCLPLSLPLPHSLLPASSPSPSASASLFLCHACFAIVRESDCSVDQQAGAFEPAPIFCFHWHKWPPSWCCASTMASETHSGAGNQSAADSKLQHARQRPPPSSVHGACVG